MTPPLIHRLAQAIREVFTPAADFEFSVEIDPTMVDRAKIGALAIEGITRASIGVQDFDPQVQTAIGPEQPYDVTQACIADLRATGISSLNADLVPGLPFQTIKRLDDTIKKVMTFELDRVALFDCAPVPWVSKRQKLIKEATLRDDMMRYALATPAATWFVEFSMTRIGIDHFAKPGDTLYVASQNGYLRRNFQGYTADTCQTLIGLGASSISRFSKGYRTRPQQRPITNASRLGALRDRVGMY